MKWKSREVSQAQEPNLSSILHWEKTEISMTSLYLSLIFIFVYISTQGCRFVFSAIQPKIFLLQNIQHAKKKKATACNI